MTGRLTSSPVVVTAALALLALAASMALGPDGLGWPADPKVARMVLIEIRLPRAILGFFVGGALGLSGAVLQGYLRNPLAEPGLLGISGGAALGAVVAIHTGVAGRMALALPLAGLAGASAATGAIAWLAGAETSVATLLLAGIAISSLAAALTALALNLASNPFASTEIMFWLMGSLTDRSLQHVWLAVPLTLVGMAMLLTTARDLEALSLGEDVARNLGVDLGGLRFKVIAGTALTIGAATSVTGAIGFVGLIIPHVLRPFVKERPGALLLPSLFAGAAAILIADCGLRTFSATIDLRIGTLAALIGAPFFVWLVVKKRREFTL